MTLEAPIAILVLLAAVLHASWNAITKAGGDPLLTIGVITLTGSGVALLAIPFVPLPAAPAWPYLILSMCLHGVYQLGLVAAYRIGDLSLVYPIARGFAPCVVAAWAAAFAGETLGPLPLAGLGLVSLGIASLSGFASPGDALRVEGRAIALSLGVGMLIGSYTFVDGQGVRVAGTAFSFIVWSFFLDGLVIAAVVALRRRTALRRMGSRRALRAVGGGLMATLAYAIVLWALDHGGMAQVAALRETSVIVAALIGTRLLGEPFGGRRVAASLAVAVGIALLQS